MIQVLALTDGDRDKFAESVSSFRKHLKTTIRLEWIVYSKKHDEEFREWALKNFPWLSDVKSTRFQMREAWDTINQNADYVIETSDGYELIEEFDVDAAVSLIDDHPYLAQLVLAGQEIDGEIILDASNRKWVEGEVDWSRLPSMYRTAITDMGWPISRVPEERMTTKLVRNSKSWRSAFLESGAVVALND